MKKVPSSELRVIHLDMIRGLAALLVCVQHLRHIDFIDYGILKTKPALPDQIFYWMTSQGHNAVMIFFVLSGFFVAGSVARDFENNAWSWPRFAIRRLTRLYVVLIPALLLTLFWDSLSQVITQKDTFGYHGPGVFCASLLFLQSIVAQAYGTNSPLWSVAYEFWYYLMFPLLFGALTLRHQKAGRILSLLLFFICILILPHKVLMGGVVWLMGYGAFVLLQHKTLAGYASSVVVFISGLVGLVLSVYLAGTPHGVVPGDFTLISFRDLFTGLSFSLTIPFLAKNQPASVWYRATALGLADISYTLYSVHFPLVVFLSCFLIPNKTTLPSVTAYALFAGYLAIILLYATAMWWLFESRTGKIRKFVEQRLLSPGMVRASYE